MNTHKNEMIHEIEEIPSALRLFLYILFLIYLFRFLAYFPKEQYAFIFTLAGWLAGWLVPWDLSNESI